MTDIMTDEQLAEIKARVADITTSDAGWVHNGDGEVWHCGGSGGTIGKFYYMADAEFSAHAPADFRALLAEVGRLRNRNTDLEALARRMRDVLASFEVIVNGANDFVWITMRGGGTTGKAIINLGRADRVVFQVASLLEEDRKNVLSEAAKLLGEGK